MNNFDAAHLKLHLLSNGIQIEAETLQRFAHEAGAMERRRAYNDSDDVWVDRNSRKPQELLIGDVVVAVNHKHYSPWCLRWMEADQRYYIFCGEEAITPVCFPQRPKFFERSTLSGVPCSSIANLYGGFSLAFFTPATCYYFSYGLECRFCSLKPTRSLESQFLPMITPALAAEVLKISLETDPGILRQIMLVGGNASDYDTGFRRHLDIARCLEGVQTTGDPQRQLETHIATMPPKDFKLLCDLDELNARVTMNIEVFDENLFEEICPGKAQNYGRKQLMKALEYAACNVTGLRVHTILIAGLEPVASTIAGIRYFASCGITPIVNVFHNDRGSRYENHSRPTYEELLEIACVLQETYRHYDLTPYWKGCGRNAMDYEALNGWFSAERT